MSSATASGGHGGQSLSLAPPNANPANSGSTSPFNSSSAPNFPLTPTKIKEEEKRIQMVSVPLIHVPTLASGHDRILLSKNY